MKKIFFVFLFLILFVIPFGARAQTANEKELVNRLKTACYDQYYKDFLDRKIHTNITPIEGAEPSEDEINGTKEQYKEWAQTNVDLVLCYEKELADYPEYSSKIADLKNIANKQLQKVESFDFSSLMTEEFATTSTIKIGAKETKVFRLFTFCLDSGRGIPDTGEDFYLAGATSEIRSDDLCTFLKEAQKTDDPEEIQSKVWDTQKFPTKEPVQTTNTTNVKTSWSNKAFPWIMVVGGLLIFLLILIFGIIKKPSNNLLKILWIIGLIIFLGAAGYGAVKLKNLGYFSHNQKSPKTSNSRPKIQTVSGKISLIDAVREGKVKVKAFGTGQIVETDIMVSNNTNEDLELDTVCLYFLPTKTTAFGQTSKLPFLLSFITRAFGNPGMGAQRLGSVGSLGEGPPIPSRFTKPEDLLTTAMKQLASQNLKEALEKFKENPTEENLQKTLEELGNCQAVGCDAEEGAMEQIKDTWQGVMDQEIEAYKNDSSTENQEALLRATETGQYLGCDDSAALTALGL